jgi:hypothetical protein
MTRIKEIEHYFDLQINYHKSNLSWYKQKITSPDPWHFVELLKQNLSQEEIYLLMVERIKKDVTAILQVDSPTGGM